MEAARSDCRADAGYGDVTAFREELERRQTAIRRGSAIHHGSLAGATASAQIETKATGRPPTCVALRQAAARRGQRSCAAGPRLEEGSLAGRKQRLVRVSLLGDPRAAFPRISRGPRRQAKRSGCWSSGRRKLRSLPGISSAICLLITVFDDSCKSPKPMEDRAGLSATQGGTRAGSL